MEDLVDVADVDARCLEPAGLRRGARGGIDDLAIVVAGLEQEPDLDAAGDGVGERGADLGVGVAVHRDVDRLGRGADHRRDLHHVRRFGGLRGEQRLDLGGAADQPAIACGVEQGVERGRADVGDRVELGERVEQVVIGGPERRVGAVAMPDDVGRDPRGDPGRGLELGGGQGTVVDESEDAERLGRAFIDAAVGLAAREAVVLSVLDLGIDAGWQRESEHGQDASQDRGAAHAVPDEQASRRVTRQ